ncbi:MAG TPA: hypothetical protein VH370_06755 [Humisphaera sp.]|nr:hypothetical protein [Humisphaera sp.]
MRNDHTAITASPPEKFKVYWYLSSTPSIDFTLIVFPHWAPAIAFSVLPAIRLIGVARRRNRFSAGHCPSCGYDLRATPERCPECGATPGAVR